MSERQTPEEIARECCLASLHGPSDLYCCCREIAAALCAERARVTELEAQCAAMRAAAHRWAGEEDGLPEYWPDESAGRELLEAARSLLLSVEHCRQAALGSPFAAVADQAIITDSARLRAALGEGA